MDRSAILEQLGNYGSIGEKEVETWVDLTIPKAERLIVPSSPFYEKQLRIEYQFIQPEDLPLGRWMGCYPELKGEVGHLTLIRDWSFFLAALYLALTECCSDEELLWKAMTDHSRLKLGVTNDVYQPFAPLPEDYSMVRHHSLILYLAINWFEPEEQIRWKRICQEAGRHIADLLRKENHPLVKVSEWEKGAKQAMLETAAQSCSREDAQNLLNEEKLMKPIFRYLQLTCFGIHVLDELYRAASDANAWCKEQIEKLSDANYLHAEILHYVNLHAKGSL